MICIQEEKKVREKMVLIVEDDYMAFWLLSRQVCRAGGMVLWAHNGREAVEKCNEFPDIGLVFMDINMPEMDGFEATEKIKQNHGNLPIIMQTAFPYYEEKAHKAGCDMFITKPLENGQVEELLTKYLKNAYTK